MLSHLQIKNYALIRQLEMQPAKTLNIITGETGAGKSIMLGALGLLLGKRADTKVLLDQENKCIIEGVFSINQYHLQDFFQKEALDYEEDTVIRREITTKGKSRAFINDTPVSLEQLKTLGAYLVDIHSQHDTLLLAASNYQLFIIDSYAQNDREREKYRKQFDIYKDAQKEYNRLSLEAQQIQDESDYNSFLLNELTSIDLDNTQQDKLERELKKLENAEDIKVQLLQLITLLDGENGSINDSISQAVSLINKLRDIDPQLDNLSDRLSSIQIEAKDIIDELKNSEEDIIHDPHQLEQVQEQLSSLFHLQQKHKVNSVEALLEIRNQLEEKVLLANNIDDAISKALNNKNKADKVLKELGNGLSKSRLNIFNELRERLIDHLQSLGIPEADILFLHNTIEPTINGFDDIQILFSANKGVKPETIKQVASGGEFSRLMFAIKYLLANKVNLPTIIFDEIDSGISGEVAIKMIAMMKEMAASHQVIAISHLPQFAAKGDQHFFVYKDNSAETTASKMRILNKEERVEAIAEMLGGSNPSELIIQNAKALLYSEN